MIHVGTSGWQYDDWRGDFYPASMRKSAWLTYFADRFPTVEVNSSFYRLPTRETVTGWRRSCPDGFVVAMKASRYITHVRRLRDPKEPVSLLWDRARRLGPLLGPVLFQLPPNLKAEPGRLEALLRVLPKQMRAAFEFRHASWMRQDVIELMDRAGAALVWPDRPGTRSNLPETGGWGYIRFHQGRRDAPGYRRDKLRRWADRIAGMRARDVFAYFNNDARAAAVHDADTLTELLAERGLPVARRTGNA